MKNKGLFERVGFASAGIKIAFQRERSLRFHAIATLIVTLVLLLIQPPFYWWAIIFITIAIVVAAEMFNSAIEGICDLVQPKYDERIKAIKDIAAGGVLVTSLGAVIVGVLLLFDTLFSVFGG